MTEILLRTKYPDGHPEKTSNRFNARTIIRTDKYAWLKALSGEELRSISVYNNLLSAISSSDNIQTYTDNSGYIGIGTSLQKSYVHINGGSCTPTQKPTGIYLNDSAKSVLITDWDYLPDTANNNFQDVNGSATTNPATGLYRFGLVSDGVDCLFIDGGESNGGRDVAPLYTNNQARNYSVKNTDGGVINEANIVLFKNRTFKNWEDGGIDTKKLTYFYNCTFDNCWYTAKFWETAVFVNCTFTNSNALDYFFRLSYSGAKGYHYGCTFNGTTLSAGDIEAVSGAWAGDVYLLDFMPAIFTQHPFFTA